MANLGTLRSYKFTQAADDIRGDKVFGRNDEKLGEISDVIFDHQSGDVRYAVVDTGGWFTHKLFLVPADQINVRGGREGNEEAAPEYWVNLSKDQIQHFPKYDPDAVQDTDRWNQYENSYRDSAGKYFEGSGVLHQAGSANIITPPATSPRPGADDLPPIDANLRKQFDDTTAGAMNTTPTAWGDSFDNTDRLAPTPSDSLDQPDLETTDTSIEERNLDTRRSTSTADLNRVQSAPFRKADVGAPSSEGTRLEQQYSAKEAQPFTGEFVNAPSAPDRNWVAGNRANTSDAEFRTAEGDSIYNSADTQEKAYGSQSSGIAQDLSKGSGGVSPSTGSRWSRFEDRIRNERDKITAHNQAGRDTKDEAA